MSITLGRKGQPHYNRMGQYALRLPGERKPRGFTRATSFIKALDQGDGLAPWMACATMVGALRDKGLHAKWAALFSEAQGDPWYHSDDTKKRAKALVEECKKQGGASSRADLGTALHSMLEQVARGERVHLVDPYEADVEAWRTTLAAAGVEPDPAWLEVSVYVPQYEVVGTFDLLARARGREHHVISDNKTETSTDFKGLSHAAQLALYSLATHAIVWPDNPEDECQLLELPAREMGEGLIIHLPAGEARCELHAVDLEQGRTALEVAAKLRGLDAQRKRKDTGGLMAPWKAQTTDPFVGVSEPAAEVAVAGTQRLAEVAAETGTVDVTSAAREVVRQLTRVRPSAETADEGERMDDTDVDHMLGRIRSLPAEQRAWAESCARGAHAAGHPLKLRELRTRRRWEMVRVVVRLAQLDADDALALTLIHVATGHEPQGTDTAGGLIGTLTIAEAERLVGLCDAVAAGAAITYGDDGTPAVVAA